MNTMYDSAYQPNYQPSYDIQFVYYDEEDEWEETDGEEGTFTVPLPINGQFCPRPSTTLRNTSNHHH